VASPQSAASDVKYGAELEPTTGALFSNQIQMTWLQVAGCADPRQGAAAPGVCPGGELTGELEVGGADDVGPVDGDPVLDAVAVLDALAVLDVVAVLDGLDAVAVLDALAVLDAVAVFVAVAELDVLGAVAVLDQLVAVAVLDGDVQDRCGWRQAPFAALAFG